MDAEDLVLSILAGLPEKKIAGKKRLQKLSYLLKRSGTESNVSFILHDFGPFSVDIAKAADFLSFIGDISEDEQLNTQFRRFITSYHLVNEGAVAYPLDKEAIGKLRCLDRFQTLELEVAATIDYFLCLDYDLPKAIEQTKKIKSTKVNDRTIEKSREIFHCIE